METVKLNWKNDMAFDAIVGDKTIALDAPMDGSEVTGVRPKPLILVALAGCTGMDVASLAKKMRLDLTSFEIDVDANKTDVMPVVYTDFTINYRFIAPADHKDKIIKITTNSQEKYCGVAEMLRHVGTIKYNVYLNGELILSK